MDDFNGFDKGVIGRKLPSDTTLNNMRKADLIELLRLAESNHRVLAETYKIAIDTSKCNHCPLSLDTRRAEQIRADAIEETKPLFDIIIGYDSLDWICDDVCGEFVNPQTGDSWCTENCKDMNFECVKKWLELKEQNNDN